MLLFHFLKWVRGIADALVLGPQQLFGQELRRLTSNYHDYGMLVEEKYGKEEGKEERLRELQSKKNQAMAGVNKYDEISTNMADSLTDTLTALEQDRFVQQDNFFAQLAVDVNRAISGTLPAIGVGLVTKRPDITTGLIFNQSLVEGKTDVEATLKKITMT